MKSRGKKAVCILGMHRSGTSAVTRALNLTGVYLGNPNKLMAPNRYNPKGFWEHSGIVHIHNKILDTFGYKWDTPKPLPDKWWKKPSISPFKKQLKKIVQRDFANKKLWGWKDPRTCLILPLWQEILEELNIELSYVIIFRNPLDVAASLKKRNNFTYAKSFKLWKLYTKSALAYTENANRIFLHYDKFLNHWETNLKRASNILQISWDITPSISNRIQSFLSPSLRHSKSKTEDLSAQNGKIYNEVKKTYDFLLKAYEENFTHGFKKT